MSNIERPAYPIIEKRTIPIPRAFQVVESLKTPRSTPNLSLRPMIAGCSGRVINLSQIIIY
jgi:hypothetical protein